MIFNKFDQNSDVVAGRSLRVSTGIWPNNVMSVVQSGMVSDFLGLIDSNANPSYGSNSKYNVHRTMYYLNVFPTTTEYNNSDPYFSIAYGNVNGNKGSGSFTSDIADIRAYPSKVIYTQYSNLLANSGLFYMKLGSSTIAANDIWVISFSSFKMKNNVDAGALQFSLVGANGTFTFIDDSQYVSTVNTSYQIIQGNLTTPPTSPTYEGLGTFFPASGIVVLNASAINTLVGLESGTYPYSPIVPASYDYAINHYVLFNSIVASSDSMNVQCSEFIPSIQYYIRVKNKEFNYSNNPTYTYDGTDGVHPAGYIYNPNFITNPQTYITTVGLYNDSNELIAVAKLSRPLVKSFSSEALLKIRIDT
jgi:hypothetical protein